MSSGNYDLLDNLNIIILLVFHNHDPFVARLVLLCIDGD